MTMPEERTRAVIQTHDFLVELSRDKSLPEKIRRDAKFLLRHYPVEADMLLAARLEEQPALLTELVGPIFGLPSDNKS
ncbi:BPSL0761 family protein [Pseudomonas sp. P2757]|uniref:BPSL0761 family protein n=1 Tax=unclassified Pseudomonas TaxID=196821 RepID=UPI003B58D8D6